MIGIDVLVVCRPIGVLCESELPAANPMELEFRVHGGRKEAA